MSNEIQEIQKSSETVVSDFLGSSFDPERYVITQGYVLVILNSRTVK
jgi:hypothetical protein